MELSPRDWLAVVEREYLGELVAAGGAAVKFAVASDESDRQALRGGLRELAERHGYLFALVDAADTRLHLMDRLFQHVSHQVDWDELARAFLARVLTENGCRLPVDGKPLHLQAVADLNGLPEAPLRLDVARWLYERLFKDYAMSQELRLALVRLCRAQLDPDDDPETTAAVREWLRGELRLISSVKRALIFQKINRHNARHLLFSLAHWVKLAGKSGLVLVLDISRFAAVARPADRDGGLYYSNAAVLDAYEVLRQFIDGTDELEHCFVGLIAGPELTGGDPRRSYQAYSALYLRLADDVRSRHRQNPLGALVRIGAGAWPVPA